MVDFAGLSDRVRVIHGAVDDETLGVLQDMIAADNQRLAGTRTGTGTSTGNSASATATANTANAATVSTTATGPATTTTTHSHTSTAKGPPPALPLPLTAVDLLFIDHEKSQYLSDLQIIESHQLLQPGSVVVADNVLSFGRPLQAYLDHVRGLPLDDGASAVQTWKQSTQAAQAAQAAQAVNSATSTEASTDGASNDTASTGSPSKSPSKLSPSTLSPTKGSPSKGSPPKNGMSPTAHPPTTPYSSSSCYKCFIEYARAEEYVEELHGAAAEVDGVEVSVYAGTGGPKY
jgi:hypothetical protein